MNKNKAVLHKLTWKENIMRSKDQSTEKYIKIHRNYTNMLMIWVHVFIFTEDNPGCQQ